MKWRIKSGGFDVSVKLFMGTGKAEKYMGTFLSSKDAMDRIKKLSREEHPRIVRKFGLV